MKNALLLLFVIALLYIVSGSILWKKGVANSRNPETHNEGETQLAIAVKYYKPVLPALWVITNEYPT